MFYVTIDRLNEIGFSWNITDGRWMSKFEEISKYKADKGHFEVPSTDPLYSWVAYQRKLFAKDNLPDDRVELLTSIGFDFDATPRKPGMKDSAETWESRFEDLEAFKEENGSCDVPQTYESNPALAKWVAQQRIKYKKGNLPDDKIGKIMCLHRYILTNCRALFHTVVFQSLLLDRLNDIGFDFSIPVDLKKLGALKVPKLEPVDRESYLESLWDKSYEELAAYKEHFGHCNIPISYEANPSLGAWAFSQRMAFKKNRLSEERIEKLTELGFSFGPQKKSEDMVVEEV